MLVGAGEAKTVNVPLNGQAAADGGHTAPARVTDTPAARLCGVVPAVVTVAVFPARVAVIVPVAFGALGMINPSIIFWLGACVATVSLSLSFLVPRHPAPGNETVLAEPQPQPAE